jgi:hypothetical protein
LGLVLPEQNTPKKLSHYRSSYNLALNVISYNMPTSANRVSILSCRCMTAITRIVA